MSQLHATRLTLRPYQREAVTRVLRHFRHERSAACLVLPTGAGKSLVIAELCRVARGRALVLAHVKELCEQNYQKFVRVCGYTHEVGLYSAGLGQKQSAPRVVFGSVQSVAPHLADFSEPISLLVIDECHRVSRDAKSQYQQVIESLKQKNPNLCVLGLTATPYRLGMGWCYRKHYRGIVRTDESRPFESCIYEVSLQHMLQEGYLTPPTVEDVALQGYDFSALEEGEHDQPEQVNALLGRYRRVTRAIIEHVVALAEARERRGVMIFAATVEHAREILSYLPEGQAGLVVGDTHTSERDSTIAAFTAQKLRYLVNVAVLTTGFDAPHVDFIAILRSTESVSLFQQIVGRGLRRFPDKRDCLVMDFAGNGFNLLSPEIGEKKPNSAAEMVQVTCPQCEFENDFWGLLDDAGHVIEHYGRRCHGMLEGGSRCDYRFRFKECPQCQGECDIAARSCPNCRHAIVDPDQMLKDALRLKDALVLRVSGMQLLISGEVITIAYHDEDGAEVRERFNMSHRGQRAIFNRTFARRIASGRRPLALETADHVRALFHLMPRPDFVIARCHKAQGRAKYWRVRERVFDYQGRFRKAAAAS